MDIIQLIAADTKINPAQINQVVTLINDGNTIPFIARYRKEATGNLDEVEIRLIRDQYDYMTELEERKKVILSTIEEQGKLTDELREKITSTIKKQVLEDLYLPYKPKKRTRATIAKEMGLEPLAELMRDQKEYSEWLQEYLKSADEETTETEVRQRARDIIAEWISEDAEIKEKIRDICWANGKIKTEVQSDYKDQKTKFEIYYDYSEPIKQIPAHRYLAVRRGEEESVLKLRFDFPEESIIEMISEKWINRQDSQSEDLKLAVEDSYQRLLSPSIEVEIRVMLKTKADEDSIKVFSDNLKNLLLAPLGGSKMIMGIDPGFKSGSKWVVVDETGKFHGKGVIYPVPPQNQIEQAKKDLSEALKKYPCKYICIGNGTASREIMSFIKQFLAEKGFSTIQPVIVNESGASVYSASDIAREEFPELDVSFRGSISIARRFQDPLAELVKIDPKAIGVGQYQHDVNQKKLKNSLDEVVESCVNYVGVNLNTASVSLLSYVSGMNKTLAKNVVDHRNENGAFKERNELINVKRFGPKSFQQAAGFLRIQGGSNPLDQSAVHPENYPIVLKMADDIAIPVSDLIRNEQKLNEINISKYQTEEAGMLTLKDIIDELKKPGRDPRGIFVGAKLEDAITKIEDLEAGMELEGTVTNLTNFGAFVDVGVHHDGLVHLSEMSDRFIKEPSEICSVGDIVKVKVINVDIARKRIGLSMKSQQGPSKKGESTKKGRKHSKKETAEKRHPGLTGKIDVDLDRLAEKFKGL
ncbi:RNA-binding transcriptional accessory protein [bacterium]|nr:RNA-binding transcriptional accessory protein [bacterium]